MERVQYATSMKRELRDVMKELSEKTRIPQSKLMDEAIEDLIMKYKIKIKN